MICKYNQKHVVDKLIEQAKIKFYSGKITDNIGDQKELFSVVNDLLQKSKKLVLPKSDSDGALVQQFSDFYSRKIMDIRKIFPCKDTTFCI